MGRRGLPTLWASGAAPMYLWSRREKAVEILCRMSAARRGLAFRFPLPAQSTRLEPASDAAGCSGSVYDNGEGVPEDIGFAYMWWNLAAAQGQEAAQSNKDILEERMTREQIAEGQRLSREWLEAHPPSGN